MAGGLTIIASKAESAAEEAKILTVDKVVEKAKTDTEKCGITITDAVPTIQQYREILNKNGKGLRGEALHEAVESNVLVHTLDKGKADIVMIPAENQATKVIGLEDGDILYIGLTNPEMRELADGSLENALAAFKQDIGRTIKAESRDTGRAAGDSLSKIQEKYSREGKIGNIASTVKDVINNNRAGGEQIVEFLKKIGVELVENNGEASTLSPNTEILFKQCNSIPYLEIR